MVSPEILERFQAQHGQGLCARAAQRSHRLGRAKPGLQEDKAIHLQDRTKGQCRTAKPWEKFPNPALNRARTNTGISENHLAKKGGRTGLGL